MARSRGGAVASFELNACVIIFFLIEKGKVTHANEFVPILR